MEALEDLKTYTLDAIRLKSRQVRTPEFTELSEEFREYVEAFRPSESRQPKEAA